MITTRKIKNVKVSLRDFPGRPVVITRGPKIFMFSAVCPSACLYPTSPCPQSSHPFPSRPLTKQAIWPLPKSVCVFSLPWATFCIQVAQGCGRNHADDVRPTGFRQQRWRRGRGSAAVSGQVLWQALGQQCCPCRLASSRPQCSRICRGVRKEQPAGWDPTEEVASACLGPLPSSPGLVPAVRGPWAVAGGVELQVHVQGGAWASNKLCRAPSLAPFTAASVSFLHRGRGCTNYARL